MGHTDAEEIDRLQKKNEELQARIDRAISDLGSIVRRAGRTGDVPGFQQAKEARDRLSA